MQSNYRTLLENTFLNGEQRVFRDWVVQLLLRAKIEEEQALALDKVFHVFGLGHMFGIEEFHDVWGDVLQESKAAFEIL